jgi:hypothetical protein
VDKKEHIRNADVDLLPQLHYGQLRSIYRIHFSDACKLPPLDIAADTEIWMVEIKRCVLTSDSIPGLEEQIKFYQDLGRTDCADITIIEGLVGRVRYDQRTWAILDRNADVSAWSYDLEGYEGDTVNEQCMHIHAPV